MAKFAKEANNAAKALSSTTNEYAEAALIFYQQGTLTDSQIAERTAATIKMANVTGEAAKDISSYMTAIWNNFDDGTKSIEYYADAITALGAATASSSEEIATGMQEFAAIGKTVGLSYDYAASALATVVAATRQSEETVGTSFKTIFSRLQSL
jgi:TP901 family phage tail tape measure protein